MGNITKMDPDRAAKPKKEVVLKGLKKAKPAKSGSGQGALSGAAMDRPVDKRGNRLRKWGLLALVAVAILFLGYSYLPSSGSRSLSVDGNRIVISPVTEGIYEDFIPVRGRVTPAKTVYLDAIEGGRVERVLVEDGALVEAEQLIVELSNTNLQLSVTRNEAMVAEQLNTMRSIELSLEQNRLMHKRNLVEINYQIKKLSRQLEREKPLLGKGSIPQSQYDDTRDALDYYKDRLAVTLESQATDERMQEQQLEFLQRTGEQLEKNLAISRQNLDNMNVRAPVAGKLSGFDVEVGQSIKQGGRLGQIDTPDDYKLAAEIDEYYLGRVDIGQSAVFERGSRDYSLTVSKIYPQVQNGQFRVDMTFDGEQPEEIRRGQTIQAKLILGDATPALLIPNGAYFQDTGGNWLFVVTADGSEAVRRKVRLGRRNSRHIEILDGLEQGERVVTSPYSSYLEMDRLTLE